MNTLPAPMDKAFAQWKQILETKAPKLLADCAEDGGKVQLILEAHADGSVSAFRYSGQGSSSIDNHRR